MGYTGILAIGLSVVLFVACGNNAQASKSPLEGAWQVVDVRFGNDRDDGTLRAQPGQFIFTPTRYAAVWVTQTEPRTQSVSHFQPTPDEIIAHYRSVAANSGTYEVSGSRITIRPIVAKLPDFAGGQLTYEYRIERDMLFLESVEERSSGGIVPPDFDATREKVKLRRVE